MDKVGQIALLREPEAGVMGHGPRVLFTYHDLPKLSHGPRTYKFSFFLFPFRFANAGSSSGSSNRGGSSSSEGSRKAGSDDEHGCRILRIYLSMILHTRGFERSEYYTSIFEKILEAGIVF